jgi:hypothetical protein
MKGIVYLSVDDPDVCCDNCEAQEEGRHYCLLLGRYVKNMDLMKCDEFEKKEKTHEITP